MRDDYGVTCVGFAAVLVLAGTACEDSARSAADEAGDDSDGEDGVAGADADTDGDADIEADGAPESSTVASITVAAGRDDPGDLGPVLAMFCRCAPPQPEMSEVVLYDPPCTLLRDLGTGPQDWTYCTPLDVGEVTVEIDSGEYVLASGVSPGTPCVFSAGTGVPQPAPGTPVRFRCSGGPDLPAFDRTLTTPGPTTLLEPAPDAVLAVGEPWTISWDPPGSNAVAAFIAGVDGPSIHCRAETAPPLVIPAALTDRWPATEVAGNVGLWPESFATLDGPTPVYLYITLPRNEVPVRFAPRP